MTIAAVDRQIANGFRFLTFEPSLERNFETDTSAERRRYIVITSLIALFFYDAFLFSDWRMLHDVFGLACFVRLMIFTPYVILNLLILSYNRSARLREVLVGVAPVVANVLIAGFFLQSTSPYRFAYSHGLVLIMIFAAVLQRLRFRYAIAANIGMLCTQYVMMMRSPGVFDAEITASDCIFFISAAILLVTANYALEREQRRSYLLALRGRLLNEQLDRSAKVDPLTGLWNRRHLSAVMDIAWADSLKAPAKMAVILLDVDHFKRFNDTYGHIEGDRCLEQIGQCLSDAVSGDATAFRFGGEEFLIFVPDLAGRDARTMAEDLRAAIRHAAIRDSARGPDAIMTASFGVAVTGSAATVTPATLIAAADKALYEAKARGRDCVWPCEDGQVEPRYAISA